LRLRRFRRAQDCECGKSRLAREDPRPDRIVRRAAAESKDFEEAVPVNLGDDADTVGAVTGQIARAALGYSAIPEHW